MKDKSLELMTEEELKFHEEFTRCQNMEEIYELEKRWAKLNESRENNTIPHCIDLAELHMLEKFLNN